MQNFILSLCLMSLFLSLEGQKLERNKINENTLVILKSIVSEEKILELVQKNGLAPQLEANWPQNLYSLGFSRYFVEEVGSLFSRKESPNQNNQDLREEVADLKEQVRLLQAQVDSLQRIFRSLHEKISLSETNEVDPLESKLKPKKEKISPLTQRNKKTPQTYKSSDLKNGKPESSDPKKNELGITAIEMKVPENKYGITPDRYSKKSNLSAPRSKRSKTEEGYDEAIQWSRRAAQKGNTMAMNNLGYLYWKGCQVEQNGKKALTWFEKAANLGNSTAMTRIGDMYWEGDAVEKSISTAIRWYKKAASLGDQEAIAKLAAIK